MAPSRLDRRAPPLFRQGPSLLPRWGLLAICAMVLMLADKHWQWGAPVRVALHTGLAPVRAIASSPVRTWGAASQYFQNLRAAQTQADVAERELARLAMQRAELQQLRQQVDDLRKLMGLREQRFAQGLGAEIVMQAPDPYSRKVIINKGSLDGVRAGSPVLDAEGVLGQVVQVYPNSAVINLLIGQGFTVPVRNQRSGELSVAYGVPHVALGKLELRYLPSTADIQEGDVLTTSGLDGVYPANLLVATIDSVDRKSNTTFAKVFALPAARMNAKYALIISPLGLERVDAEAATLATGAILAPTVNSEQRTGLEPTELVP